MPFLKWCKRHFHCKRVINIYPYWSNSLLLFTAYTYVIHRCIEILNLLWWTALKFYLKDYNPSYLVGWGWGGGFLHTPPHDVIKNVSPKNWKQCNWPNSLKNGIGWELIFTYKKYFTRETCENIWKIRWKMRNIIRFGEYLRVCGSRDSTLKRWLWGPGSNSWAVYCGLMWSLRCGLQVGS